MTAITATLVKQLRDATNVSMMECKRALVDADGDVNKAGVLLRERGVAVAAKKADRVANQGLIATATSDAGNTIALVEVNCETDFVARNENFVAFVSALAEQACNTDGDLATVVREDITSKIAEIGENIIARRNTRYVRKNPGSLGAYVHSNHKIGVLLELGCEKDATASKADFRQLLGDLCLHVAACCPRYLTADQVPESEVKDEKSIYAKQVEGKPDQIVKKIVDGKLRKFFEEICFLDQGFVKEPKQSITDLLAAIGKTLGDTIVIRRFVRFEIGR